MMRFLAGLALIGLLVAAVLIVRKQRYPDVTAAYDRLRAAVGDSNLPSHAQAELLRDIDREQHLRSA